jgi:hypothetical protein
MQMRFQLRKPSNQSMKPTPPFRNAFTVFATTPCRGLSLSHETEVSNG